MSRADPVRLNPFGADVDDRVRHCNGAATGLIDGLFGLWMATWVANWLVAFPTVLVVAPVTRRIVGRLTRQ